ncbi:glutathione ABC transporter substrate-binding protein [Lacicoccus alkaliphilus]|uniref:Peptide/nickel transport system substrate-binding protein n=1 Tax=Lacicoccus alkaliphilus DSM 16010 TaxID=1123231 RepID=A0A1M7HNT1_9BACL|nr:glutathione ABC transporter substrate-binding protein [Salinicoccus alkaliphilus]SHM29777.1 peptide/nickel transport system substrate-binding protein [Salinicoccus alkaliphilus DSM 16010]
MNGKYYIIIMVVMAGILTACTNDQAIDGSTEAAEDTVSEGGDFIVSTGTDAVSMDPHGNNDLYSDQVRNTIYEGLVKHDENMAITPLLAEEYEQVDEVTWRFSLRNDVVFHDGSEFNAEVVKANLERVTDPATASPRLNIFEMIEEVNVIDDYTVEIITEYPFAPFLNHLTHNGGGMISKAVIDEDYENALESAGHEMSAAEYYDLRQGSDEEHTNIADDIFNYIGEVVESNPTGTNYAAFSSRSPGEKTVVEKFDDYWGEPMNLDTVTFKIITETNSRIADLETGNSHMIMGYEGSHLSQIEQSEVMEPYTLYNMAVQYIGFNTESEPMDDKRVRQAISHLVDRQEIIDGIYSGSGKLPKGIVTSELLGYDESLEGYPYDVERAQELMEEAGYEDGFEISILTNDDDERINVAVYLQEALEEINVKANVEQLEWGAFLEKAGQGEHDIFIQGAPNSTGDPDQMLWDVFHSSMKGTQGNRTFFDDEGFDQLLQEGREATSDEEREEIYKEAQAILEDEAPMIYFRETESMNAYGEGVEGLYIDHFNRPDFRDVTITN